MRDDVTLNDPGGWKRYKADEFLRSLVEASCLHRVGLPPGTGPACGKPSEFGTRS